MSQIGYNSPVKLLGASAHYDDARKERFGPTIVNSNQALQGATTKVADDVSKLTYKLQGFGQFIEGLRDQLGTLKQSNE